jgi:hypothetical protein
MKSTETKPPYRAPISDHKKVFLAGSIEQGIAENWQEKIVKAFPFNVDFLNPRRDNWDTSWEQDLNNPNFYEQVTWELDMLDSADIILMYFDPNTKSPISLMELGLYAKEQIFDDRCMMVCCPEGFWRKGNVDIVCQRYHIPVFTNIETLIVSLKNKLK